MKKIEKSIELAGRTLTLTTGHVAEQASGAVMAQYGETVVLATVMATEQDRDLGYFPLSVEYQERLYAGGKIKGSRWVKREGRPSDDEILKARLIDRSIRPLFPENYKKDVQVIITVLSVDLENDPIFIAPIAVAAAIEASEIPWHGPVSILSIGLKDGEPFLNPRNTEKPYSDMDLIVSTTKDAIVMIEAGANEVTEENILKGIEFAQKESVGVLKFISDLAKEVGIKKEKVEKKTVNIDLEKAVKKLVGGKIENLVKSMAAKNFAEYDSVKVAVKESVTEEEAEEAVQIFEKLVKEAVRSMILSKKRPDGRKLDEIRPLNSTVGILPRTHGSAIFKRGSTQALTVATLGSPSLGQLIESAEGEEEKRYIHHYTMPPYSIGETGRVGYPSRREIGHGALAERALIPVIPSEKVFPYTIRLVSEILSSNGSTSMASTCGSTLALMDAGVPIKSPVSGIAMGLVIKDETDFAVISDITGMEDFNGDMDFKIAGTKKGVTALQLDVKALKLTLSILKDALTQAKGGRAHILESMLKALPESRKAVSKYAPKIVSIKIDPEKIGGVIGPGGKIIKQIISETGAQVDVEDDGTVNVSGIDSEGVNKAIEWVKSLVKEVKVGEIYEGTVKRIQAFGAFVEILPGKEGLIRVGDMSTEFVQKPQDVVSEGQEVKVRVKEIDNMGRINLSMILDPAKDKKSHQGSRPQSRPYNNRPRRSSSPHFPASRFTRKDDRSRR